MKPVYAVMACILMTLFALPSQAMAGMDRIALAPLHRAHAVPPLGRKQGWLAITNRDWEDYYLEQSSKDKLFLHRERVRGRGPMIAIPSGATITIAIDRDSYDLMGETSDRLRVRVREGRTTTLSLEPFGYRGNSGLVGIVNDGDRVRKETLYDTYSAPVIVPAPPPVVIERPAPPPPVVVTRPPVVVERPVVVHPAPGRRPPPPPPPPPPKRKPDGWGFFFGFDSGGRR